MKFVSDTLHTRHLFIHCIAAISKQKSRAFANEMNDFIRGFDLHFTEGAVISSSPSQVYVLTGLNAPSSFPLESIPVCSLLALFNVS